MKIRHVNTWLLGSVAGAAMLLGTGAAQAVDFKFGEIDAKLDTTVSLGIGVRTSKASCEKVGVVNGGCLDKDGYNFGTTSDNSNILNSQWNPYSTVAKVVSELSLTYQNYGAFVRGTGYYDYWGQHELGDHTDSRWVNQPLSYNTDNAHDINRAGYGLKLLDAFVYGKWDVADQTSLNVRLGNQVVNWGESLFIQGGINSFQPIDANAIVKPGSELKEAYTPDPLIDVQLSLPDNFGFEMFYKFGWNKTTLPVAGTFFGGYSSADGIGPGMALLPFGTDYTQAVGALGSVDNARAAGLLVDRADDVEPSSQGQFGAKLGYYADWLNDGTDMALYFSHYHSPMPYLDFTAAMPDSTNVMSLLAGGVIGGADAAAMGAYLASNGSQNRAFGNYIGDIIGACVNTASACTLNSTTLLSGALLSSASRMNYLTAYAPHINQIGWSFNTVLPVLNGTAFSGEVAFSPNMPFQRDVYAGILANNVALSGLAQYLGYNNTDVMNDGSAVNSDLGSYIVPWARYHSWTGQLGTVSTLSTAHPVTSALGGDLSILVANVGFQYIDNLRDNSFLSGSHSTFNSYNELLDTVFGQKKCPGGAAGGTDPTKVCPDTKGYYASSFSWGYRLTFAEQYNNAFGTAVTLTPHVVWSHDVGGISAGPIGPGFVEGIKKVSLGVSGSYGGSWQAGIDWTTSFGNRFLNDNIDKDYATATISYAF